MCYQLCYSDSYQNTIGTTSLNTVINTVLLILDCNKVFTFPNLTGSLERAIQYFSILVFYLHISISFGTVFPLCCQFYKILVYWLRLCLWINRLEGWVKSRLKGCNTIFGRYYLFIFLFLSIGLLFKQSLLGGKESTPLLLTK